MKEQLKSYVDLLFAGAPDATEIKQEILQNTLDRYDDLIAQGKTPQAAYQLAISGIGDINELLGSHSVGKAPVPPQPVQAPVYTQSVGKPVWKRILQAIGVCLYIMCPAPLFVLQNATGLCGLLTFVAVATALMVISSGKSAPQKSLDSVTPESELRRSVKSIIGAIALCVYLAVSFLTQAWFITWLIFPIMGAVRGIVIACMDLKEACKHEK